MLTMIEHFNGGGPTNDEMRDAPVLYRWLLKNTSAGVEAHGFVQGHPHLPDHHSIRTSDLVQIDPSKKPLWLRTESRIYSLGKPMGGCEWRLRKDLWASDLAVWREKPSPEELREFKAMFGQRRSNLDEAERILLLLARNDRIDITRAKQMHKLLLREISR